MVVTSIRSDLVYSRSHPPMGNKRDVCKRLLGRDFFTFEKEEMVSLFPTACFTWM